MALTNSTQEVAEAQLSNAGIGDQFEQVFSADTVRRLKPAPEPYQLVAEWLELPIEGVTLMAAHSHRGRRQPDPLGTAPTFTAADLMEVAQRILAAPGRPG